MEASSISAKDFEQIKELGTGSFGRVTLVRKKSDDKLYAMKSVLLSRLNQKQRESALNEVRLLASIRVPYVISYKGAFFNNDSQSLCVVMEFADGGDLQNKITERTDSHDEGFEENYIWKVAYQLLNACKKLHEKKIVHRDIKAANVFFANDIAKLGDLNVSKVADKGWCETHTGTPYYTSPEIWNGQKYSEKCDIWSIGCLIYEMCMLNPPFKASDFPSLFRKVIVGEYQQISSKYSQDMKDFIRNCLTVNDKQRLSAQALLDTGILSGMQLSLENFRYQGEDEIQLIDPIKCPRVLKFLNNKLPKTQFESSQKKTVGFVTKKEIEVEKVERNAKSMRKILSEKVIQFDFHDQKSHKKIGSKKNIKLPPIQSEIKEHNKKPEPLTFTLKKTKANASRLKIDKQNIRG